MTIAAVFLAAMKQCAHADPVVIGTSFTPLDLTALLTETLIVAILLTRRRFDFVRMLYTWFPITLATYWMLLLCGDLSVAGLSALLPRVVANGALLPALVFLVLEIGVVFVEAWVIMRLALHRFYRMANEPFRWKQALLVSVCGNAVSLIIGFAWMFG